MSSKPLTGLPSLAPLLTSRTTVLNGAPVTCLVPNFVYRNPLPPTTQFPDRAGWKASSSSSKQTDSGDDMDRLMQKFLMYDMRGLTAVTNGRAPALSVGSPTLNSNAYGWASICIRPKSLLLKPHEYAPTPEGLSPPYFPPLPGFLSQAPPQLADYQTMLVELWQRHVMFHFDAIFRLWTHGEKEVEEGGWDEVDMQSLLLDCWQKPGNHSSVLHPDLQHLHLICKYEAAAMNDVLAHVRRRYPTNTHLYIPPTSSMGWMAPAPSSELARYSEHHARSLVSSLDSVRVKVAKESLILLKFISAATPPPTWIRDVTDVHEGGGGATMALLREIHASANEKRWPWWSFYMVTSPSQFVNGLMLQVKSGEAPGQAK